METKRIRSENWTKEEKETLLGLVQERFGVIERKSCDGVSAKLKRDTWQEILHLFEAKHGAGRGMLRVREQWKKMKLMAKHRISKAYQEGADLSSVTAPCEIDYMIMDLIAGQFCKSNDSDSIETLNYNDSSSSIHKGNTDCSPSLAVARHSDSSEALESEDIIEASSFMSSVSKGDMAGHARKRRGEKMSAYEESMYNLCAEKIRIQIKILEEKAKREEEIHKGELEIQELQKMYWRDKIKKND